MFFKIPIQILVFFLPLCWTKYVSHDPKDIHFYLYSDRQDFNHSEEILFKNDSSLAASSFKPNEDTVFMVHGLSSKDLPDLMQMIKDEYLSSNITGNFIIMDWYKLTTLNGSNLIELALGYVEVVTNVPTAARRLSDFIQWLQAQGVTSLDKIHVVGHSLGAHVSGQTGKNLIKNNKGTKLARITGLDPAGPLFTPPIKSRNLNKDDAKFVQAIHTNAFILGDATNDGHIDFFVNGGTNQPNCTDPAGSLPGSCSHVYAVTLFSKSINKDFKACPCTPFSKNWKTPCPKKEELMGQHCRSTARGQYCVKADNPP